ncbi:MAG: hypothetical protein L3J74_13570, partial [Bacteroidales bacterium]|nr:hypothetical protein [Bacteroidales bacterium]
EMITTDVVGPICETGDFFARGITIPNCERGDYLAILMTGAYGFTESSNYNLRVKPPEVIIEDGKLRCIRPKQKYDEIN